MPRVTLAALAAVASLLVAAPAASAAPETEGLAAAAAAWPDSPCKTITVLWATDFEALGIDGYAHPSQCTIEVNAALTSWDAQTERVCDVIVHEAAHLAGLNHDSDLPIMDPSIGKWPACHPVLTERQELVLFTKESLPRNGTSHGGWKVWCARTLDRCHARAPRARTRVFTLAGGVWDWTTSAR